MWKQDSFLESAGNFELSHDVEIYLIYEACLLPPAAAASHVLFLGGLSICSIADSLSHVAVHTVWRFDSHGKYI